MRPIVHAGDVHPIGIGGTETSGTVPPTVAAHTEEMGTFIDGAFQIGNVGNVIDR